MAQKVYICFPCRRILWQDDMVVEARPRVDAPSQPDTASEAELGPGALFHDGHVPDDWWETRRGLLRDLVAASTN